MDNNQKIFLAIDANAIIHRAFHAYPSTLQSSEGIQTNAVYGFSTMLLSALERFHPEYILCAFDTKAPTFRHEMFPEYKGTRKPTDQSLIDQFPLVEEVLNAFNIPIIKMEGYEADDILGSFTTKVETGIWSSENLDTYILSGDKDLLQLVSEDTKICLPNGSFKDIVVYDRELTHKKYGFYPEQVIDYKALVGDPSDNIPGIKGMGEKTVLELLRKYESFDEIYRNIGKEGTRVQKLLTEGVEQAEFSKELATIRRDIPLAVKLEDCLLRDFDRGKLEEVFKKFGFRSLFSKLDDLFGKIQQESNTSQLDIFAQVSDITWSKDSEVIEALKKDSQYGSLVYVENEESFNQESFCIYQLEEKVYISKNIFDIPKIKDLTTYGFEEFLTKIDREDIDFENIFDVKLMAHLLRSELKSYLFKDISFEFSDKSISGKISPQISDKVLESLQSIKENMIEAVDNLELYPYTKEFIKEYINSNRVSLTSTLKQLEQPISVILSKMERRGVTIKKEKLEKLREEIKKEVVNIEKEIFKYIGHEFNINSPKQLGQILFDELQLPGGRSRTTKESVLKGLVGTHPVVEEILKYRETTKILNTYVEPLYQNISDDCTVHTNFHQIGTSSGRFSSSNPNMQNLPGGTKWAEEFRECLVAREGFKFLAVDYSQMELRIMAHLSKDLEMIRVFNEGVDIHIATASAVLGKEEKDISKKERALGKTINFGMIFGQTPFGLSRMMGIDTQVASDYINTYFKEFKGVEEYMRKIEENSWEKGYIQSIFGTTRNMKAIRSKNIRVRRAAAREAINMPIQGSEADIMKYVMTKLNEEIDKNFNEEAYILLQIHDELVFEVKDSKVEDFAKIAKKIMSESVNLDVKLEVNYSIGNNLKEVLL